jgi:hypothetical protein
MTIKVLKPTPRGEETLTVLHPDTYRPLATEGEAVEFTSYWVRRMLDGDVVEVGESETPAKTTGGKNK